MSRRSIIRKKVLLPDLKYDSFLVTLLIKYLVKKGKYNLALKIVYKAFLFIEEQTNKNALKIFEQAIINSKILFEFKTLKSNISSFQIPIEMDFYRSITIAIKNILIAAKKISCKSLIIQLANEIICSANGSSESVKKCKDNIQLAKTNKLFLHIEENY